MYDPSSPILCGSVDEKAEDKVTERKLEYLKYYRISIFDLQGDEDGSN